MRTFLLLLAVLLLPTVHACTGTHTQETRDFVFFEVDQWTDEFVTNLGSQRICIDVETGQWRGCGHQVRPYADPCITHSAGTATWSTGRIEPTWRPNPSWGSHATGAKLTTDTGVTRLWGPVAESEEESWDPMGRVFSNATHAFVFDPAVGLTVVPKHDPSAMVDHAIIGSVLMQTDGAIVIHNGINMHILDAAGIRQSIELPGWPSVHADQVVAWNKTTVVWMGDDLVRREVEFQQQQWFPDIIVDEGGNQLHIWMEDDGVLHPLRSPLGPGREVPVRPSHLVDGYVLAKHTPDRMDEGFTIVTPDGRVLVREDPRDSQQTWIDVQLDEAGAPTKTVTATERIDTPLPAVVALMAIGLALVRRRLH